MCHVIIRSDPARRDHPDLPGIPERAIQDDTGIKPPWSAEACTDLEEGVRQSRARIAASPFVPRKDAIRGFVFDVATGKLNEVA
jgi:carbonic anhydrase